MRKLRVMTIVGTRPEIIRLSRVIAALDRDCDHVLVHTGQNYDHELSQIFFDELGIRAPDHHLECGGPAAASVVGHILIATDRLLAEDRPDAVLVLGDTNSCLAVYPAKRRRIPIFHMEAGNRCFDQRVPEEINRTIIDHIADINLPYSDRARDHLLREGVPPDRIIKTGSPMFEVLAHYRDRIDRSDILDRLGLAPGGYHVVSAHREENIEDEERFVRLIGIIDTLAERSGLPLILSTHPRMRDRLARTEEALHPGVRALKPLGFPDYVRLQEGARAVLSDSGTITEEASILGFPALNLREAHERPEGMEEAVAMMTGLNAERVWQALAILERQPRLIRPPADYQVPNVAEKVVRIIHSYTDYVRRLVWQDRP